MKLHVQDADFYLSSKKQCLSKCFCGLGLLLRSALFASVVESGGEWWRVVESGGAWWSVVESDGACSPKQSRAHAWRARLDRFLMQLSKGQHCTFMSAGKHTFVTPSNR
jgi:hypothetical protein